MIIPALGSRDAVIYGLAKSNKIFSEYLKRCVQARPTGAFHLIQAENSEIERIKASEKPEALYPEYKTGPRVYYKNLNRYLKCFIGGSVAVETNGITDCAEGVKVTLTRDSNSIQREQIAKKNEGE